MHSSDLFNLPSVQTWAHRWLQHGMICAQTNGESYEVKTATLPDDAEAFGCGGWDLAGKLHWVGIDLDVGHGGKNAYTDSETAVASALELREFVNNAAEVRLSKSGTGVHVRIAVTGVDMHAGRTIAPLIAKWLAKALKLRCDPTVLGRQNLWFWAKNTNESSFYCVAECEGTWRPPPGALEPEALLPTTLPVVVRPTWFTDTRSILIRAQAYMEKVDPAISGQEGHRQCFHAACALVKGFSLSIEDARPLLYTWNLQCQPPWSEKELEHKLSEAFKARLQDGYLLTERPESHKSLDEALTPKLLPSDLVWNQIADEITGKRYACSWPWQILQTYTRALLPGNVMIFSAPPGASKSFFMLEAVEFWRHRYKTILFQLEETKVWTLRRWLAQVSGVNGIANDPEWTQKNSQSAGALHTKYKNELDAMGNCIAECPPGFSTATALGWLKAAVEKGHRIVVIDPITARDPSEKPWIDDHAFVRGAEDIMRNADCSLVLVTHPKDPDDTRLDSVAGGKAFQRFTQVVVVMEIVDPEEVSLVTPHGAVRGFINRRVHLRKTRNGSTQDLCIGYFFNSKTLLFEERGIVRDDE